MSILSSSKLSNSYKSFAGTRSVSEEQNSKNNGVSSEVSNRSEGSSNETESKIKKGGFKRLIEAELQ